MKIAIEIPIEKINILLFNDVKAIINRFSDKDCFIFYFFTEKNPTSFKKKINSFLAYIEEKFPKIHIDYILSPDLLSLGELVLFSTLLYKDVLVNRDSISLKEPINDLKRLLMTLTFADFCFFVEKLPFYLNGPFQYKENIKLLFQNQKMEIYSLFCNNSDFNYFITHLPIKKEDLEYLSHTLNKNIEEFKDHHQNLRKKLIEEESLFLEKDTIKKSRDMTLLFCKNTIKILRKISNFDWQGQ